MDIDSRALRGEATAEIPTEGMLENTTATEEAAPQDRWAVQLGLGSEGTKNTNGTRGYYERGLSGAQATAGKAVFKQTNKDDVDMAPTFILPISSSSSFALVFRPPLLPMPLVPSPPDRTIFQSYHAGTA